MKNLEFYTEYLQYLEWRLNEGEINKGKFALLKISEDKYKSFVKRLENSEDFNHKVVTIIRAENRDRKIDEIFEEEVEIEETIDEEIEVKDEIDDFFDEFDL